MNLFEVFMLQVSPLFFYMSKCNFTTYFFVDYLAKIVQYKLADIGEGIAEVEMKEW